MPGTTDENPRRDRTGLCSQHPCLSRAWGCSTQQRPRLGSGTLLAQRAAEGPRCSRQPLGRGPQVQGRGLQTPLWPGPRARPGQGTSSSFCGAGSRATEGSGPPPQPAPGLVSPPLGSRHSQPKAAPQGQSRREARERPCCRRQNDTGQPCWGPCF